MAERHSPDSSLTRGGWRAYVMSVLLHGLIVAIAWYGWFTWKHEPPKPTTLAIEATVVDARSLVSTAPPPAPEPAPVPEPTPPPPEPVPEPEEQGPPKPDPAELERKQEEERKAEQARERESQEKQQRLQDEREAQQLAAQKEAAEKAAAEKAAAAKAAAERAAAEKKAAEKKRAEDAAAAKKAAEEKARQARETELRKSLEAEERADAARNSDEAARWHAQIVNRITRAWIRPPSARAGIECIVLVNQVPGGEVTGVRVQSCTGGDAALRESVEAAVYRASPLPTPPPGVPFERNLELTFAPHE
jgi:colicin import membrane protein